MVFAVFGALRRLVPWLVVVVVLVVVAPVSAATVTIVAAGDIACAPASNVPSPVACQQEATAQAVEQINPSFVAALGDNQYETGSLAEYQGAFAPTWGRFKDRIRPTAGNHEWLTAGAAGYFDYFGSQAGERGKGWYSYQAGDWHVIVLDSQCNLNGGCGAGSEQDRWLRGDLAAHRAESCTLAYYHIPPFTGGAARDSTDSVAARPLFATLHEAQVDLVVTGHEHSYQRFAPLDQFGNEDRAAGLREIVVGTGGKDLKSLQVLAPNTEARDDKTFGVLELTLRPTDYAWKFHPVAGGTFTDTGSTPCHRAPAVLRTTVRRGRLATVLRRGLRASVRSDHPTSLRGTASVNAGTARRLGLGRRSATVASGRSSATAGRATSQTLRFTRRARRALGRASRVTLTVRFTATTPAGRISQSSRRISLR